MAELRQYICPKGHWQASPTRRLSVCLHYVKGCPCREPVKAVGKGSRGPRKKV